MEFIDEWANHRLRISSKRLKSGKVQVSFKYRWSNDHEKSGYLLAEPKTSLKDVVHTIMNDLTGASSPRFHRNLLQLGKIQPSNNFVFLN